MNNDQQRGLMRSKQVKPSEAKLEQVRQALGTAEVVQQIWTHWKA